MLSKERELQNAALKESFTITCKVCGHEAEIEFCEGYGSYSLGYLAIRCTGCLKTIEVESV